MSFLQLLFVLLFTSKFISGDFQITTHPSSVDAAIGGSVSFSCAASEGTFDGWVFNGQSVSSGGDYSITSTSTDSTISLASFSPELAGDYRCRFLSQAGTFLTLPGQIKYFVPQAFEEDPQDFDSYVINPTADGIISKIRETIALQCTYPYHPSSVKPVITWQSCHSNGTFTDILETSNTFEVVGIPILNYVIFQSGLVGYFQIIHSIDPIYNGSRVRCQASSSVLGDTASAFSECATIIQHPEDVPVPDDLPVFSTIPQRQIDLVSGETGVMACSIQRRTDSFAPAIYDLDTNIILQNSFLRDLTYEFIDELNLVINTSRIVGTFQRLDFICTVVINEVNTSHLTTFTWHQPIGEGQTESYTQQYITENFIGVLNVPVGVDSTYLEVRLFKDGSQLDLNGSAYSHDFQQNIGTGDLHSLTIASASENDAGVFQVEVENKAGMFVKYFEVKVNLQGRAVTPHQTVTATVSESVTLTCEGLFNLDDTTSTFLWRRRATTRAMNTVPVTNGSASNQHTVSELTLSNDGDVIACAPTNIHGNFNTTQFTLVVVKFLAPKVTGVAYQPGNRYHMTVTWAPIDLTPFNSASINQYKVTLHVLDGSGNVIDTETQYKSGSTNSTSFDTSSIDSDNYFLQVVATDRGHDISNASEPLPTLRPMTATALSQDRTITATASESVTVTCEGLFNLDDSMGNFSWKLDNVDQASYSVAAMNGLASSDHTLAGLTLDHDGSVLECEPLNIYGSFNSTRFTLEVEKLPAPEVTGVAFQPGNRNHMTVTWAPIDLTPFNGASINQFTILLHVLDGSGNVERTVNQSALGNAVSTSFDTSSIESDNYRIQVVASDSGSVVSNTSESFPVLRPLAATALSQDRTITATASESVTVTCEGLFNLDDSMGNFSWKLDNVDQASYSVAVMNGLASSDHTLAGLTLDHDGSVLECEPLNIYGSFNSTRFTLEVEKLPAPEVTGVAFQPGNRNHMTVTWAPIDLSLFNGASINQYTILLHVLDGSGNVERTVNQLALGNAVSTSIDTSSIESDSYRIQVVASDSGSVVSNTSESFPVLRPLAATALSQDRTITATVSESVTVTCEGLFNLDDSMGNFSWKLDNVDQASYSVAAMNGLASSDHTLAALTLDHDGSVLECEPLNIYGSFNSTRFTLEVEKLPAPKIDNVTFDPNDTNHVIVTWSPIDLTQFKNASISQYRVDLIVLDKDGNEKVILKHFVPSNETSTFFNVSLIEVDEYRIRVGASDDGDFVSDTSGPVDLERPTLTPTGTEFTPSPTVLLSGPRNVASQQNLPGWGVGLIVFFLLLAILLLILFLILFFFCLGKSKSTGSYNAEKREAKYYNEFKAYQA